MILRVRVLPNAARSEIVGWEDDPAHGRLLKIRIAAPPVDGKANTALRDFLAERLKVPRFRVNLLRGGGFRIKTFELPDDTRLPG